MSLLQDVLVFSSRGHLPDAVEDLKLQIAAELGDVKRDDVHVQQQSVSICPYDCGVHIVALLTIEYEDSE